jgi:uncharacterized membrane protein YciS (DUF1049 family)
MNGFVVFVILLFAAGFCVATMVAQYYYVQYKLLKRREETRKRLMESARRGELDGDFETVFGDVDVENLKGG